jgi:hypothetical protein
VRCSHARRKTLGNKARKCVPWNDITKRFGIRKMNVVIRKPLLKPQNEKDFMATKWWAQGKQLKP